MSESQPTSECTPHIINGHYTSSGNQPSTILSASYMPLVEDDTKFHSILQLNTIASLCLSMWLIGCYTTLKASRTVHVCLSVCLSACSLVPSIGKTESVAASSCKEVRDVLSNECSGGPQSGTYRITVTDPCTQHNRTMRVG